MTFVYSIKEAITALQEQIDLLQGKADNIVAKPWKFEEYIKLSKEDYQWTQFSRSHGWSDWNGCVEYYYKREGCWSEFPKVFTQEHIDKALATFDETAQQWKTANGSIRAKNALVAEHNQLQKARVISIMKTIGVSDTYSTYAYKTSRSRNKTETKHNAGYLGDLGRYLTVMDNYKALLANIKTKRDSIETFGKNLLKVSQKEVAEQKKIEDDNLKVNEMAGLRAKYTPDDYDSDIDEIREVLLGRDKYLHLAYWLERNRGDWNDGYYCAERGLSGFEVETEIDQLIEDDIQECIDSAGDGVDGRIFRDTTYDYGTLYGMVEDGVLLSDLELVQKYENLY